MNQTETESAESWGARRLASTALNRIARMSPMGVDSVTVRAETDESYPYPPAPAWYDHKTGDASVHFDRAGIDLGKFADHALAPHDVSVIKGLVIHELAHSKWSGWMNPAFRAACTPLELTVVTMFEELRIEQRAVSTYPPYRLDFRASLKLALGDLASDMPSNKFRLAYAWGLVYGRAITTVIDPDELRWLDDACETLLGDAHPELVDILQEAIEADADINPARMVELAREWIALVGEPDDPDGDQPGDCGGQKEAQKEEEEGSPNPGGSSDDEDLESDGGTTGTSADKTEAPSEEPPESLEKPAAVEAKKSEEESKPDTITTDAGIANSTERGGEPEPEDEDDLDPDIITPDEAALIKQLIERMLLEIDDNWDRVASDMADPREQAQRVFGAKPAKSIVWMPPTHHHRNHVTATAAALENIAVPAITKVRTATELPPGRLRTREAVRGSAERSMGRMVTSRPWEGKRRTHARVRPIVLGIATDVSGSMAWATDVVADIAYVWTNAGQRVGARTAAVAFGDRVIATAWPGKPLPTVPRKPASEGSENADRGLAALDGVLKLSHPDGAAKLLVIVSDGHFVIDGETARVLKRLEDFKRAGTKVIWITPSESRTVKDARKLGLADVILLTVNTYHVEPHEILALTEKVQREVLNRIRTMSV